MSNKATIRANVDYVSDHLRYGHFEAELDKEQLKEFKSLNSEERKEYIRDVGELVIDDFRVNDYEDLGEVELYED